MEEPPVVKNPSEAVYHPVVVTHDFEPKGVHSIVGAEKPVRANIHPLIPKVDRAGQATDCWADLED